MFHRHSSKTNCTTTFSNQRDSACEAAGRAAVGACTGQDLNGRRGQLVIELVIDLGGAALGPPWDHTLCAMLNDLRVHERHASRRRGENHQRTGEMRYRYFLGVKWSQVQILSARQAN